VAGSLGKTSDEFALSLSPYGAGLSHRASVGRVEPCCKTRHHVHRPIRQPFAVACRVSRRRSTRPTFLGIFFTFVVLLWPTTTPAAAAPPSRIVSLNLCTDQILLDLVPRERIAALSWLAADRDVSPVADDIAGLKLVRGGAEEILALAPDLVLANPYAAAPTVDLLKRLGYATEVIPFAQDFDGIRLALRRVAAAVGEMALGEALVTRFDAALASTTGTPLKDVPIMGRRPEALVYQVNGLVSGSGSLIDAALAAAGLGNQASTRRLASGGRLALEALVAAPPDLVVLAQAPRTYATVVSDNLRHPALRQLMQLKSSLVLPMPLWLCGSPRITDAIRLLRGAAATLPGTARGGQR
jgi:iron complex transport system substrate-binding protein